ncbi:hypothetical protein C8J57DRAFT_1253838 [Mycena rebaudengoi]|nr:hypothetical protein C8J57DRAFT_1253838 [Mycena rebaudengoi]
MCFCIPHSVFCPVCEISRPRIISVFRCAPLPGVFCGDWTRFYSNSHLPVGNPTLDFIDVNSDAPYRDLNFVIRPCADCAVKIIRGARLIRFEQDLRNAQCLDVAEMSTMFVQSSDSGDTGFYTKPTEGYSRYDYPPLSDNTAPIYLTAVRCSGLMLPPVFLNGELVSPDASVVEETVRQLDAAQCVVDRYDAMEFMEWSWEFSAGSLYGGVFGVISSIVPSNDRVASRLYDPIARVWAHPFQGEWAVKALAIQMAPFGGKDVSDVLRSYTVNGVQCDKSLRYLAPDCFAHTTFLADDLIHFAREYADAMRTRNKRLEAAVGVHSSMFAGGNDADVSAASVLLRQVTLNSASVYQSVMF